MSTLGKAVIEFSADTAKFVGDVGRAAAVFESSMARMQRGVQNIANASIAGASIAGVGALIKSQIDLGEETLKLSQKVGISVENLSGMRLGFQLAGGDTAQFQRGLKDFNEELVKASNGSSTAGKLMKAMGVDIKAEPYEALRQFADQFAKLPNDQLRTAVASEVFKKSAMDWIPVLLAGSKGMDDSAAKARALGVAIDTDFAKASNQFNDQLKILETRSAKLGITLAKELLPFLNEVTKSLSEGALKGQFWGSAMSEAFKIAISAAKGLSEIPGAQFVNGIAPLALANKTGLLDRVGDAAFADSKAGPRAAGKINYNVNGTSFGAAAAANGTPDPDKVRKALSDSEALTKRQIAAIQQMEEKKKSLFNLNEMEIVQDRIKTGTYKEFDAQTKSKLTSLAKEIDLRKQVVDRIETEAANMAIFRQGLEQSTDAQAQFFESQMDMVRGLEFENAIFAKLPEQQQKMQAMRQFELQAKRMLAQIDQEIYPKEYADAVQLVDVMRGRLAPALDEQIRLSKDWQVAAGKAMDTYTSQAMNAATQTQTVFSNSFRTMEDALVNFIKTGKLDFKSLADSIITDLIRVQVQREIMAPLVGTADKPGLLSQGLSSLMGSIFKFDVGTDYVPHDMIAMVHRGEKIIPASQNTRGSDRGIYITQNIAVDSRSDLASVNTAMRAAKDAAVAEIYDRFGRGDRP